MAPAGMPGGVPQLPLANIMPAASWTSPATVSQNFMNNPLKRKHEDDDYDHTWNNPKFVLLVWENVFYPLW